MTTGTAQPGIREVPPVEVEDGHRSKRLIVPGIFPRCDPRLLPTTPARLRAAAQRPVLQGDGPPVD
jgi:hypothetical protein